MCSLHVSVRSVSDSAVIRYYINKHFNKLARHYTKMRSCKVVIDAEQKNPGREKVFSVLINLSINKMKFVSKKSSTNLFLAIRDAFAAIEKSMVKTNKRKIKMMDKYLPNDFNSNTNSEDPNYPQAS